MTPPGAKTVIVRHGDVNTKSQTVQTDMERQLVENIEALLADRRVEATVERQWSRLFVHAHEDDVDAATDAASDAFGVVSASPALRVDPEMDAITDALAETARETYDGGTIAVDARRAGTDYPFTSVDVERQGGTAVIDAVGGAEVDLTDPDETFYVEVRRDDAYVFREKLPGPGGLPLGSQSPVVALVSGGIDSPVAAFEVMKRGSPVIPVYADLGNYGGPDHEARAFETVRSLSRYAPNFSMDVHRVPLGPYLPDIADEMEAGRMLAFRRLLFRAAEHVAREEGAYGIVTGEALGQKSSQTAANLAVTSEATALPVLRPLLTMDKQDIVARARVIDTFVDSTIPAGCNRFAPNQAETHSSLAEQLEREPDALLEWAREAASESRVVSLSNF